MRRGGGTLGLTWVFQNLDPGGVLGTCQPHTLQEHKYCDLQSMPLLEVLLVAEQCPGGCVKWHMLQSHVSELHSQVLPLEHSAWSQHLYLCPLAVFFPMAGFAFPHLWLSTLDGSSHDIGCKVTPLWPFHWTRFSLHWTVSHFLVLLKIHDRDCLVCGLICLFGCFPHTLLTKAPWDGVT